MPINRIFNRSFVITLTSWIAYFLFWIFQYSIGPFSLFEVFKFTSLQMGFYILGTYINNNILVENFLYKKKFIQFVISYIFLILGIALLLFFINNTIFYTYSKYLYNYNTNFEGISANIFLTAFAVSIPAAFKLNIDRMKSESDATKLLKDKIQEELKFLKSQINPHFLFNSINSVYNLIDINPEEAKNTLVKFSEILRYTLYEASKDKISVAKEFEYIQAYSAIEKTRKGKSLEVTIEENIINYFEVPPLLLLTFIENAFKHVSSYQDGNFVNISIEVSKNHLIMIVNNSKDSFNKVSNLHQSGGIGLENIKRRLELLYPDKYELTINETDLQYNIKLKLYSYE